MWGGMTGGGGVLVYTDYTGYRVAQCLVFGTLGASSAWANNEHETTLAGVSLARFPWPIPEPMALELLSSRSWPQFINKIH